jgi:hypothetical protein
MTNMDRKVLAAFLVVGLVGTLAAVGIYAKLVDTEKSAGNTFSASSGFDLKTMDWDETVWKDGVSLTWTATNMKPGDTFLFPDKWVLLSWLGPLTPSSLEVTCNYSVIEEEPQTEADTDPNTNLNPDSMAKQMIILSLKYNGVEYADDISDIDGNEKITFFDLKNAPLTNLPIPSSNDGGTFFRLSVKFSEDAGNDFQGDTFDLTMIFTLKQ